MADVFDVTRQGFENRIKQHALPGSEKAAEKKNQGPTWWARGVIEGWLINQIDQAVAADRKTRKAEAVDEAEAGAISRTRELNQRLLVLKLRQQERELVPVEEIREKLGALSQILRQGFDALLREHGVEAYRIMEETLDEFDNRIRGIFGGKDNRDDNGKTEKKKTKRQSKAKKKKRTRARN